MRLRTQILLFLFLFGLTPLIGSVIINLPLVLENLELFYHKAHLQNLRADFRDLDQHLASRHEMVRLLAKLPEPGAILGDTDEADIEKIDIARARYIEWINQILQDQLDIIQILFLDEDRRPRFWLEREIDSLQWTPTTTKPDLPSTDFFEAAMGLERGGVLVSRISLAVEPRTGDPRRFMTLRLISPIVGGPREQSAAMGTVMIDIDVGGMARAYRNTLWVNNNGSYLKPGEPSVGPPQAFSDFPGLEQIFATGKLDLWEGRAGKQVIWVPLFMTETGEPLWVGRSVDPSPLAAFRNALTLRVLSMVLLVITIVWFVARWFALRLERFGQELTTGIGRVLRDNDVVEFSWQGPQELHDLGEDLSQLAKTHAQHTRELQEHARQLEESNRYKSEFLANVSHELRTPLNSILLLSKMLGDPQSGIPVERIKQARVIHEAGDDLKALIDNILDISRIEAGQAGFKVEEIDIRELIGNLMELVRPQFEDKNLDLELKMDGGAPERVITDREKLRQILKNFLSNAVKFTSRGGATIEISRNNGDDEASRPVRIAVHDTGIGIPADKQDIVFEAFKQADGSTSRRYGGTGLGLTISRELALLMGGRIELSSEEGKGSAFSLLLPIRFDDSSLEEHQIVAPVRSDVLPGTLESIPDADFNGRSVLLVDDDVRNLLALTPLLERWGFRVSAAGDGQEALETLSEDTEYSVILMDIMMPAMDGYDTIKAIRGREDLRNIPIIVLTARSGDDERTRCQEAGADAFIVKPATPDRLKDVLDEYINRSKTAPL